MEQTFDYRKELLLYLYEYGSYGFTDAKKIIKSFNINSKDLLKLLGFLEKDGLIKGDGKHHDFFSTKAGYTPNIDEVTFNLRLTPLGRSQVISEYLSKETESSTTTNINMSAIDPRIAFIIMQIGNPELDLIYENVFLPALKETNLIGKRIDKDNQGQLLKNEITDNIEKAVIIIADLTNERPNCYLEVGYAMGVDKYNNLIFTAREDHNLDSSSHQHGNPKIHFDLSGYDILFWDASKLEVFKNELVNKINRRLIILNQKSNSIKKQLWDQGWLAEQRQFIAYKLLELEFLSSIEILISPLNNSLNLKQNILLEIADNSQIQNTGWPLGVIFTDSSDLGATPKADGLISEVYRSKESQLGRSYDFSYFKKNGQIFMTTVFQEDFSDSNSIVIPTRINLITELLLYISKYYSKCNLQTNEQLNIIVKYSGLKNRFITYGFRTPMSQKKSKENVCLTEITTSLREIESDLPNLVNRLLEPLFVLFEFSTVELNYITQTVNEFVRVVSKTRN